MPASSSARRAALATAFSSPLAARSKVTDSQPAPPSAEATPATPRTCFRTDCAESALSPGMRTRAVLGAAFRLMSATVPSAMTCPLLRMRTREHVSSTSSRKWVLRITVAPRSLATSWMSESIWRCPAGIKAQRGFVEENYSRSV